MIRSPLFYTGDKFKVLDQIIPLIPKNKRFIDPFVGGGSILANIDNENIWINDINFELIELLKYLKNTSVEKILGSLKKISKKYNLSMSGLYKYKTNGDKKFYSNFNKNGHKKLRDDYNKTKNIELLFPLILYSYNRLLRFNSKGEYNVPVGTLDINKNVIKHINEYCKQIRTKNIKFSNSSYEEILKNVTKNDVVFIDPPYLITNAEYNKNWSEENEKKMYSLIEENIEKGATIVLTNYQKRGNKNNVVFEEFYNGKDKKRLRSFHYSFHNNKGNNSIEYVVFVKGYQDEKKI